MKTPFMLLTALVALTATQCGMNQATVSFDEAEFPEPTASVGSVQMPKASQDIAGIKIEKVERQESRSELKVMGKVLAPLPQTAIVSHAFLARVSSVGASVGDWVEKDDALLTLESQEVGEAKSEFYKALAACELAKVNFGSGERLQQEGIGPKKNVLAAEAEHKVAQSTLEAAEKRLHVLGFTEDQVGEIAGTHQINPAITLFAPISGKIVESRAVRGTLVDESTPILTIIDPRLLWVDAEIYEKDLAKVQIGQTVELTVPAYPDRSFAGTISYIGDVVEEKTRTITVRSDVENGDQLLKPGMFADITILLETNCDAVVVPVGAILEDGDRKVVFIKEEQIFVEREVVTGMTEGARQQILGGLEPGEFVVIEGNYQLRSELKKHVLNQGHGHSHGHLPQH